MIKPFIIKTQSNTNLIYEIYIVLYNICGKLLNGVILISSITNIIFVAFIIAVINSVYKKYGVKTWFNFDDSKNDNDKHGDSKNDNNSKKSSINPKKDTNFMSSFLSEIKGITDSPKVTLYNDLELKNCGLNDFIGCENIKTEIRKVIHYIKNSKSYKNNFCDYPKGVMLLGPPGCGKTHLVKSIIAETKMNYIYKCGSDFMKMYVGTGPKNVQALFEEARNNKPCMIFIDEADTLIMSRRNNTEKSHSEAVSTITKFLEEMDSMENNDGLFIIFATNMPEDEIDPAIKRAGRVDKIIHVSLPIFDERIKLFKLYLDKFGFCKKVKDDDNVINESIVKDIINDIVDESIVKDNIEKDNIVEETIVKDNIVKATIAMDDIIKETIVMDDIATNNIIKKTIAMDDIATDNIIKKTIAMNDIATDNIIKETIVTDNIVEETIVKDNIIKETIVTDNIVEKNIEKDNIIKETIATDNIIDETIATDNIIDETIATNNIIDETIATNIIDETIATDNIIKETIEKDNKTPFDLILNEPSNLKTQIRTTTIILDERSKNKPLETDDSKLALIDFNYLSKMTYGLTGADIKKIINNVRTNLTYQKLLEEEKLIEKSKPITNDLTLIKEDILMLFINYNFGELIKMNKYLKTADGMKLYINDGGDYMYLCDDYETHYSGIEGLYYKLEENISDYNKLDEKKCLKLLEDVKIFDKFYNYMMKSKEYLKFKNDEELMEKMVIAKYFPLIGRFVLWIKSFFVKKETINTVKLSSFFDGLEKILDDFAKGNKFVNNTSYNFKITTSLIENEVNNCILEMERLMPINDRNKHIIAFHETGHALIAFLIKDSVLPTKALISVSSKYLGVTLFEGDDTDLLVKGTVKNMLIDVMVLFGGRASEKIFCQTVTQGADNDYGRARNKIIKMIMSGMLVSEINYTGNNDKKIPDYIENICLKINGYIINVVENLLKNNEDIAQLMANLLFKNGNISQMEIDDLFLDNDRKQAYDVCNVECEIIQIICNELITYEKIK